MSPDRLKALFAIYRGGLIDDTLPFWIRHAIDRDARWVPNCTGS